MNSYLAGVLGALVAGGFIKYFFSESITGLYIFGVIGTSILFYEVAERIQNKKN